MKNKILGLLVLFVSMGEVFAQAPQAIPFSAAVRNANGVLIPNKAFQARFTIIDGSSIINVDSSNIAYRETQTVATNNQGLFVINIGQGAVAKGIFANINWSVNSKYVQVEIDTTNTGSVYRVISTQQLMSVPYALNAKKADTAGIAQNGSPVGTVTANAGVIIPLGWLFCNGQAVSRTSYSSLFAAIGTIYGKGDGSTTFNVPDYRGMFLRGVDAGAGKDPDTASRVAQGSGTALKGGNLGTLQADAFASHNHNFGGLNYGSIFFWPGSSAGSYIHNSTHTADTGGNETRPKNVYVNYIIKF